MQKHPQLRFVVNNPNGMIQIATQPAVKDVKLIRCQKCDKVNPVKDTTKIKCIDCGASISAARCDEPSCKGNVEIMYYGGSIVKECNMCSKVTSFA